MCVIFLIVDDEESVASLETSKFSSQKSPRSTIFKASVQDTHVRNECTEERRWRLKDIILICLKKSSRNLVFFSFLKIPFNRCYLQVLFKSSRDGWWKETREECMSSSHIRQTLSLINHHRSLVFLEHETWYSSYLLSWECLVDERGILRDTSNLLLSSLLEAISFKKGIMRHLENESEIVTSCRQHILWQESKELSEFLDVKTYCVSHDVVWVNPSNPQSITFVKESFVRENKGNNNWRSFLGNKCLFYPQICSCLDFLSIFLSFMNWFAFNHYTRRSMTFLETRTTSHKPSNRKVSSILIPLSWMLISRYQSHEVW
jgi:hypothetical protein